MKFKRWMKITLAVIVLLTGTVIYILTPPNPLPTGVQSRAHYQPGTLGIIERPFRVTDASRPTAANNDFEGTDHRLLEGSIWFPADKSAAPYPLIAYSHGFMSRHAEAGYLAEFLVGHGYVIVAVDYPLTHFFAPGGPAVRDVINQPEDISFIIDRILARNVDKDDELFGMVDPERIAAVGLSLGGLTTTLVAYHKHLRDPRLKAAISIAGPSEFLGPRFFETSDMPFMMVAADADAMVPYEVNAAPILKKIPGSLLVTVKKGSHTGFAGGMASVFRWTDNPDEIGCTALMNNLSSDTVSRDGILPADESIGILAGATSLPCQADEYNRSMRPADQLMLTRLVVYSFLESVFATDVDQRAEMRKFLLNVMAHENSDVIVEIAEQFVPRPRGKTLYPKGMPFVETLDEAAHFRKGPSVYAHQVKPWKPDSELNQ